MSVEARGNVVAPDGCDAPGGVVAPGAGPDVTTYRAAVAEAVAEVAPLLDTVDGLTRARSTLAARVVEPALATVLGRHGVDPRDAVHDLLADAERALAARRCPVTVVRVGLLSQIDAVWWGRTPPYQTAFDVISAPELVGLSDLAPAPFRWRRQVSGRGVRLLRAVRRRIAPQWSPLTAGLLFERARPAVVELLDQVAAAFAPTPLWVTSLVRSVEHQRHLRELGYPASLPSAHCSGYAVDVEMAWYRRSGRDGALRAVLREREAAGDANVIDEGQVWHVCVSPAAAPRLDAAFRERG